MAVHALADRATAGATSRWTSCTHADRHIVGHIDLVNDQVGKIGKYRHRLILDQKTASLEILFGSLVYHMPSSGLRKNPKKCVLSGSRGYSSNPCTMPCSSCWGCLNSHRPPKIRGDWSYKNQTNLSRYS